MIWCGSPDSVWLVSCRVPWLSPARHDPHRINESKGDNVKFVVVVDGRVLCDPPENGGRAIACSDDSGNRLRPTASAPLGVSMNIPIRMYGISKTMIISGPTALASCGSTSVVCIFQG